MTFTEEQYKQIIKDIKEGVVYNGDMMRWNGGPLFDPSEIISRLIEENTRLRHVLADIRDWSKHDHVMRFGDGDISLADYCAQALHRNKP